jgi:hypothetical protein
VEAKKEAAATIDETNAKPKSGDEITQKEINANTASLIKGKV